MHLNQFLDGFRSGIGGRKVKPPVGRDSKESQNKPGLLADQVIRRRCGIGPIEDAVQQQVLPRHYHFGQNCAWQIWVRLHMNGNAGPLLD